MLRTLTHALRAAPRYRYSIQATRALCTKNPQSEIEDQEHQNHLEGKPTRENIRNAFTARCMDSIRYDYFAQRAELEAETEAAYLFRSLTGTAKQQAMGYMELLEEYGDADFGDTVQNLEVSAEAERASSEGALREHALVAGRDKLEAVEEFFEDMADASEKTWSRLEMIAAMNDMEDADPDDDLDDTPPQIPEKVKH